MSEKLLGYREPEAGKSRLNRCRDYIEDPRRLILSNLPRMREMVKALRQGFSEAREERPEIVSLGVYGSSVKGTAREESDIDAILSVDPEKIKGNLRPETRFSRLQPFTDRDKILTSRAVIIAECFQFLETSHFYEDLLAKAAKKHVGKKERKTLEKKLIGVVAYPLNKKIIDDHLARMQKNPNLVSYNLTSMFFVDLGGGLLVFRKYFFDKLDQMDKKEAEAIWQKTIYHLQAAEQFPFIVQGKEYPWNLEEAKKLYLRKTSRD